jgi:hypothetical protein
MPAFPLDIISVINEIRGQPISVPTEPEFFFDMTQEAAAKNFLMFKQYKFNLGRAIKVQTLSPLGYSSEFKMPQVLQKIFKNHPLWAKMERLLIKGSQWPLEEISEENKVADLQEALQFGNHKGAISKPELLKEPITADVQHGYRLVIPLDKIKGIPGACLAPMNIMHQFILDASEDIVNKERLTHNQSFKWQSGTSVNKQVIKEELQRCMYGWCLMRLLSWIVAACCKFPNKPIMIQKIDIKSAYQRCHLNAATAIQTITQLPEEELATIMLQLTFSGAPCPFEWNIISESICNLANTILYDNSWDSLSDYTPCQHLVPPIELIDESVPFAKGAEQIVNIPVDPQGTGDVYIDNLIQAAVIIEGTNKPFLQLMHVHSQSTQMNQSHAKRWKHATIFRQRQDWKNARPSLVG